MGDAFPEDYHGAYFHADHSSWLKIFRFDEDYNVTDIDTFHNNVWGITDIKYRPQDQCLYFVKIFFGIYRMCYGGQVPPEAVIEADKKASPSPLLVQFDGSNSLDANDDPITYLWDFGGGNTSTETNPDFEFVASGNGPERFPVTLTVTDSTGKEGVAEYIVSLNNTPPDVRISTVSDGDQYTVTGSTLLVVEADVEDEEHQAEELSYKWQTYLHHNTHFHPDGGGEEESSQVLLQTYGCGNEPYWYRIRLEVTDAAGLVGMDEVELFPYCGPAIIQFLSLTGEAETDKVVLSFSVDSETNISKYEVERSLDEGRSFQKIGELNAQQLTNYSFEDLQPELGTHKYRIKAFNQSVFDYSNVIEVKYPKDPDFQFSPNPANTFVEFELNKAAAQNSIFIYNSSGVQVFSDVWLGVSEQLKRKIPLTKFANGSYFYRIESGENTYQGKLIIIH